MKGVWGWLYPLKDEFQSLELKKDEYTVGKDPGCSYVITETQLDRHDYSTLSKKHFKISKKKDIVYLENIGGTYINNKQLGDREKVILNHNDCIAIARMYIKVFVYLEKPYSEASALTLPTGIQEKFHVSYKLGQGGFGEVTLVFEKETGKRFAMKTVKKNPNILKYARTEAEILRTIQHPCIIMTKHVLDTPSTLFIVMEMMDGGDLLRRVVSKSLLESHTKLIFFQIVQAIQCLHKHNIVHRDIKPENVLLATRSSETLIKVTDFGVSKILRPGTVMDTTVGTPMYIAPEIKKNFQDQYTKQVDVWSLGVLLYVCLSGTPPFNVNEALKSYVVTFPPYKWSSISSSAVTLIKSMLQVIPTQRIGIDDILAHSWLKDETMRRRAHQLMWPGKPYVAAASPAPALATRRKNSLPEKSNRFEARGVLQYMSHRDKSGTPLGASQPQLVRANNNEQPIRQNFLFPPRQAVVNSPLQKKPIAVPAPQRIEARVLPAPQRIEARVLPQLQKFEPKPYVSPYAQNITPSQQKYQPKPYISPLSKNPLTPLSQPKLEAKPNIKPSASPIERKPVLFPPQQKFEGKPSVSPVEKRPFALFKEEGKNAAGRPFAFNKK